mmetsp:Transcript_48544/g.123583  ORF Transcript_48544/g.123583 Transcript_48544/m.123583 type:complete len:234 (-) Transcript_48544:1050-1751(-)
MASEPCHRVVAAAAADVQGRFVFDARGVPLRANVQEVLLVRASGKKEVIALLQKPLDNRDLAVQSLLHAEHLLLHLLDRLQQALTGAALLMELIVQQAPQHLQLIDGLGQLLLVLRALHEGLKLLDGHAQAGLVLLLLRREHVELRDQLGDLRLNLRERVAPLRALICQRLVVLQDALALEADRVRTRQIEAVGVGADDERDAVWAAKVVAHLGDLLVRDLGLLCAHPRLRLL